MNGVCIRLRKTGGRVKTVTDSECDQSSIPNPGNIKCNNKPCPPVWEAGNWTPCSASCGQGFQQRKLFCKQKLANGVLINVPESTCEQPKTNIMRRSCTLKNCSFSTNQISSIYLNTEPYQNTHGEHSVEKDVTETASVYKGNEKTSKMSAN